MESKLLWAGCDKKYIRYWVLARTDGARYMYVSNGIWCKKTNAR